MSECPETAMDDISIEMEDIDRQLKIAKEEQERVSSKTSSLLTKKRKLLCEKHEYVWVLHCKPTILKPHIVGVFSSHEKAKQYLPEDACYIKKGVDPELHVFYILKHKSSTVSLDDLDVPYPEWPHLRERLAKPE